MPIIIKGKKSILGFTLVEMMVAVTLFTFVMFIATSSLLSIIGLNKKARANQAVINNINAALEQIMRDIRLGSNYYCSNSFSDSGTQDCIGGGTTLSFDDPSSSPTRQSYNMVSIGSSKVIGKCPSPGCTFAFVPNFIPITSEDITIDSLNFYVVGTGSSDKRQPFVRIYISGHAFTSSATGKPERVDFALQTSASQRLPKS